MKVIRSQSDLKVLNIHIGIINPKRKPFLKKKKKSNTCLCCESEIGTHAESIHDWFCLSEVLLLCSSSSSEL